MTDVRNDRWLSIVPPDSVVATLPSERRAVHDLARSLRALSPGTCVVIVDDRAGSRRRARRLAARVGVGVGVGRSYILLPSARAAYYVVEDRPEPIRYLWQRLFTTPPGSGLLTSLAVTAAAHAARALPWWSLGAVAPGRVTVLLRT